MKLFKYFVLVCLLGIELHAQWNKVTVTQTFSVSAVDQSNIFVSGFLTNLYRSNDGGINLSPKGITQHISKVSAVDTSHVWVGTWEGKILHSSNGGANWAVQFNDSSLTTFINYVEMFDVNNGVAMADGLTDTSPAVFLKTTDGGAHWNSMNDSSFGAYSYDQWRLVQFVSPEIGYFFSVYTNPTALFKTTNGGATWKTTNYPTGWGASVIRFYNEQIGLVQRVIKNTMYRTLDGGVTWEQFASPSTLKGEDIEFAAGNPATVWYSDWNKIYCSKDTGRTWEVQSVYRVRDIEFISETRGFAVGDSGIYTTSNGGENITNINEIAGSFIPSEFRIHQNYPNPFNPATVITFDLSRSGHTGIIVTDILGKELERLVDAPMEAGRYSVRWDAGNRPAGIYFIRMTVDRYSQTIKSVLVK